MSLMRKVSSLVKDVVLVLPARLPAERWPQHPKWLLALYWYAVGWRIVRRDLRGRLW